MPHDIRLTVMCPLQRANFKLHDMEVRSKELQREYQDVHGFIAVICSFPFVCTKTCVGGPVCLVLGS